MKTAKPLDSLILTLRDQKVILDADLAELYGVPTKRLNEQVKRNADRFPPDFLFQLTSEEMDALKSHFATSNPPSPFGLPYDGALRSQIATLNKGRGSTSSASLPCCLVTSLSRL